MSTLLDFQEVRERLDISDSTLLRMLKNGELKGFKVGAGRKWRFEESDIENYIRQQRQEVDALVAQQLQEVREQDGALVEEFERTMGEFEQKLQQLPLDEQAQVVDVLLEIVKRTLVAK